MVRAGRFDIELVPSTSWGKSLYQLAWKTGRRSTWKLIRERELQRAGSKCEICGFSGKGLTCHEKWKYDELKYVQKLTGYEIACRKCSNVLHLGRASTRKELWDAVVKQFTLVTGLKETRLKDVFKIAMADWNRRSDFEWHIDIRFEPLMRAFESELNQLEATDY
jgi:hypothetical protein